MPMEDARYATAIAEVLGVFSSTKTAKPFEAFESTETTLVT